MKIEECSFGRVVIDGTPYSRDLVLFPDTIHENWWRKQGHSLAVEDLGVVFERKPAVFVMGCGQQNALKVPESTVRALADAGIELKALNTKDACRELNRLFEENEDGAGGLHLTC